MAVVYWWSSLEDRESVLHYAPSLQLTEVKEKDGVETVTRIHEGKLNCPRDGKRRFGGRDNPYCISTRSRLSWESLQADSGGLATCSTLADEGLS